MLSLPQKAPLTAYYYRRWLALAAIAVFGWWLLQPASGQITHDCRPAGVLARASEWAHGNDFWRAQLKSLREIQAWADGWDGKVAQLKERAENIVVGSSTYLESIYAKYPDLAPTDAQRVADALRGRARRIEEAEADRLASSIVRERAEMATACEQQILARIKF